MRCASIFFLVCCREEKVYPPVLLTGDESRFPPNRFSGCFFAKRQYVTFSLPPFPLQIDNLSPRRAQLFFSVVTPPFVPPFAVSLLVGDRHGDGGGSHQSLPDRLPLRRYLAGITGSVPPFAFSHGNPIFLTKRFEFSSAPKLSFSFLRTLPALPSHTVAVQFSPPGVE